MHLSPFFDERPSDKNDDAEFFLNEGLPTRGQAHRDGLLRGLAVIAVLAVLVGLGFVSSGVHSADSDPAPFADEFIHCVLAGR